MKTICLDDLLSQEEIKKFEDIYFKIKNSDMTPYQKKWSTWKETAEWINNLENKNLFLKKTVGKIQDDILSAYRKLLLPYVDKGIVITPILGTLLGIYRDNDLIRHDDDLDLGIDIFDFSKIKKGLWLKALINGWKLKTSNWFDKNGKLGFGDHAARLYQMKSDVYSIGNLTFKSRGSIDLWPITKIPNESTIENDRFNFYMHLQNIYKKNNILKYFNEKNQLKYFEKSIEFEKFQNDIILKEDTLLKSEKWMSDFYKSSKESNSKIYMPLEKDMPKINNIDFEKKLEIQIRNTNFTIPELNDVYFEKMYGAEWNIEKLTHLHLFRFKTIKNKK